MELKQLESFVAVVRWGSFTRAAERTYTSQPTVSSHVRALEEELGVRLLQRSTKRVQVTAKGRELYECARHMLELRDNLLQRWANETRQIIHLGASTIPSAYILPEVLPLYGKACPEAYFIIHQGDSSEIARGVLGGLFDIGLTGMRYPDERLVQIPFYRDRMVLITPVSEHFLALRDRPEPPVLELLRSPIILREKGSGSKKSADRFLEQLGLTEDDLRVTARINDQESVKNLVAGGLGVSILSEKAARNFAQERRILVFDLPGEAAERDFYLILPKTGPQNRMAAQFAQFVRGQYLAP
ncbi:selenium metabolism-associated LysR family transcriptional regulator [uncultured Oscillibacter sp.]|uniref:selenium metabolism-associated LysR family transcriptional regulator n=1 Tax=uncultured Oscillibacter sp. TaxID=876091 RepID=UPI0025FB9AB7|nr:selenium metabolism-associated LysR family transcriptional regulator [uncultured Oscillibacter sp.]